MNERMESENFETGIEITTKVTKGGAGVGCRPRQGRESQELAEGAVEVKGETLMDSYMTY